MSNSAKVITIIIGILLILGLAFWCGWLVHKPKPTPEIKPEPKDYYNDSLITLHKEITKKDSLVSRYSLATIYWKNKYIALSNFNPKGKDTLETDSLKIAYIKLKNCTDYSQGLEFIQRIQDTSLILMTSEIDDYKKQFSQTNKGLDSCSKDNTSLITQVQQYQKDIATEQKKKKWWQGGAIGAAVIAVLIGLLK